MTLSRQSRQDWAARRRAELHRERRARHLIRAVDAQRSLNGSGAHGGRTKARAVGLSDPRYAYLTRSHD
jgi:hypothetical protein